MLRYLSWRLRAIRSASSMMFRMVTAKPFTRSRTWTPSSGSAGSNADKRHRPPLEDLLHHRIAWAHAERAGDGGPLGGCERLGRLAGTLLGELRDLSTRPRGVEVEGHPEACVSHLLHSLRPKGFGPSGISTPPVASRGEPSSRFGVRSSATAHQDPASPLKALPHALSWSPRMSLLPAAPPLRRNGGAAPAERRGAARDGVGET